MLMGLNNRIRALSSWGMVCFMLTSLSGCDLALFGGGDDEDILPGTRISVLALERALRPDLKAVDTQIVLPSPDGVSEWTQAGGLSHHAMHHLTIGASPKLLWREKAGSGSNLRTRSLSEPIISDGTIFVLDADANIMAFAENNGRRLWSISLANSKEGGTFLGGGLALEKDIIFASTGFAEVVAIKALNGAEVWRANVGAPIRSAPTVSGGRVFLVTVDNQIIALSASDGTKLWNYSGISSQTILLGSGSPAVDGGVVIAPFNSGEIVALRADNGSILWSDSVIAVRRTEAAASLRDIKARPVIDRGRVYAVGHSGVLVAIDLRTGQRVWEVPVPGVYQPWVAGNFLYATSIDSEIVCIDLRTGQIMWVTQLRRFQDDDDQEGRIIWTGPSIVSDRVIVLSSSKEALSLSPYNGDVLGKIKMRASVTIPPIFSNASMYVYDDDGYLLSYR
jgi:outer membrane protein assembly factor BamB